MKQKAEITFERQEMVILRESSAFRDSLCSTCQAVVVMATPEAISLVCQIGEREIFRMIDRGEVHFIDGPKVYVCLDSIKVLNKAPLGGEGGQHESRK